jgi:2',3'-cyclic-nucleotide 2'-phosphodiesterase (5'-nucleotidase family)
MEQVIGITDVPLQIKTPQSELSNLLTDIVYELEIIFHYKKMCSIDMSLPQLLEESRDHLIAQGNITCRDIYIISPFENTLVFVSLRERIKKNV